MFPGVTTPAPFVKTPVRVAVPPAVIESGLATNVAINGGAGVGVTLTLDALVTATPASPVTVRV
jgi:hypothetical protein